MITWECFALHDDLVLLLRRAIEACQQEMDVCSQSSHDCNFTGRRTHNWRHELRSCTINIDERRKQLVFMRDEVAGHALDGPCSKVPVDILSSIFRLQTKGVAAQVYTPWIR